MQGQKVEYFCTIHPYMTSEIFVGPNAAGQHEIASQAYVTLKDPIWDKWATQHFEQGELGFPTNDWSQTPSNDGIWEEN